MLALPALVGVAAMLIVTRRGAYLSPDALAYVGTARNLVDGHGYTPPPGAPPVGNFPPLYPLVLAAVGALGPDPVTVARFVNPIILGASIFVVGVLVLRLTRSVALAVVAQLLVLAGSDFLVYHSSALSEPLFLLLALLAVAALAACLPRRRPVLLLVAALLAGAACLTRYVGLAVVVGGVAAILIFARRPRRWAGAIAFGAIALAPMFAWLAWESASAGGTTNRTAVFHAPDGAYVTDGVRTASTWVLPDDVPGPARLLVAALVVAALVLVAWRARRRERESGDAAAAGLRGPSAVAGLVGLCALAYLAALVADRTLFDVTGRLDARFLLPLHAAAIVLAAWALRAVDLRRSHLARIAVSAVVGVTLVSGAIWLYDATTDADIRPGGFAAPAWNSSEVIDQVRALAPSAPVYSNEVDALYFHTGRVASPVPEERTFLTGRPNHAYADQLKAMNDGLNRGGLLVYFTSTPSRRVFLPTPRELADELGLEELARDRVGVAYQAPRR